MIGADCQPKIAGSRGVTESLFYPPPERPTVPNAPGYLRQ
jgi:hypothetical protein